MFYPGRSYLKLNSHSRSKLPAFLAKSKKVQNSFSPTHTLPDSQTFRPGEKYPILGITSRDESKTPELGSLIISNFILTHTSFEIVHRFLLKNYVIV